MNLDQLFGVHQPVAEIVLRGRYIEAIKKAGETHPPLVLAGSLLLQRELSVQAIIGRLISWSPCVSAANP